MSRRKNININVRPKDLVVYSNYDDTEEILVKIENRSSEKIAVDIKITLPKNVAYHYDENGEKEEEGTQHFKKTYSILPERQQVFFLATQYFGKEKHTKGIIRVICNYAENGKLISDQKIDIELVST